MQNNRILRGESFYQRYGVSPEGLVLWLDQSDYRSYGDAGNWYDLSGNGNHAVQATAAAQPSITGGQSIAGMYRDFDGTDDFMDCGNKSDFDFGATDSFGIGAWAKMDNSIANYRVISGKADGSSIDGYFLRHTLNGNITIMIEEVGGANAVSANAAQDYRDGLWHFPFGVVNRASNLIIIYVDGILKNQANCSSVGTLSNAYSLFVGAIGVGGLRYHGQIAKAYLFRRAPSAAEIQRLYLADAPRFGVL